MSYSVSLTSFIIKTTEVLSILIAQYEFLTETNTTNSTKKSVEEETLEEKLGRGSSYSKFLAV